jgi:heme A synthase
MKRSERYHDLAQRQIIISALIFGLASTVAIGGVVALLYSFPLIAILAAPATALLVVASLRYTTMARKSFDYATYEEAAEARREVRPRI